MPILTSPTVAVVEKDYSQVVPFAATGEGAIAGRFNKGPILQPVMISSVDQLEATFGTPDNGNYVDWFSAYNFLQYSGKLWVTRIKPTGIKNAGAKQGSTSTGVEVLNSTDFENKQMTSPATLTAAGEFVAKQPGTLGNSLKVIIVDEANWAAFDSDNYMSEGRRLSAYLRAGQPTTSEFAALRASNDDARDEVHVFVIDVDGKITGTAGRILEMWESLSKMDNATDYLGRNVHFGKFLNNYSEWVYWTGANPDTTWTVTSTSWTTNVATISAAGHNAQVGDVVVVAGISPAGFNGTFTVTSKTTDTISYSLNSDPGSFVSGGTVTVGNVAWGVPSSQVTSGSFAAMAGIYNVTCVGGVNGTDLGDPANATAFASALEDGFAMYLSKEDYSVSYLITADYPVAVQLYVIQSVAEVRRDAIAFVSPHDVDSGKSVPFFDKSTIVSDLLTFRGTTLNANSSFAVMDSGYKYQFDGYNAVYRWVPLAADVAGLCARNDAQAESWVSPAGFNRGQIKNALKLSSVLSQADRDLLYPKQINAVVGFSGKNVVLYGDRTLQAKPSAFQSIHIRRMFIIIEKAIEEAAKYQLFELNNSTTRNLFVGMIEPFLRSVKARDGLDDFAIVCDTSNNTDDVIARGEFVADIYVKPLYSIQYVVLNFVAVKSSVQFNQFIKA